MTQRINPWRLFHGAFVPNWLLERADVSPGAKLLYGILCQMAGRDGHCYPRQCVLGERLGVAERQIRNLVAELKEQRLVDTEQPGLQKPLVYFFLSHPWMKSPGPVGMPELGPAMLPGTDRQDFAGQEKQSIASPEGHLFAAPLLSEKTHIKRINTDGALRLDVAKVEDFKGHWNSLPQDFPKIKMMSPGRVRALGARLRDPAWAASYREALEKIPGSLFLSGKTSPRMNAGGQAEKAFVANVDWFLRPDTVAKIIEGKYDDKASETPTPAPFWKQHI